MVEAGTCVRLLGPGRPTVQPFMVSLHNKPNPKVRLHNTQKKRDIFFENGNDFVKNSSILILSATSYKNHSDLHFYGLRSMKD